MIHGLPAFLAAQAEIAGKIAANPLSFHTLRSAFAQPLIQSGGQLEVEQHTLDPLESPDKFDFGAISKVFTQTSLGGLLPEEI